MILAIIFGVLVLACIVATVRAACVDGYRRIPYTPIARRPDFFER